MTANGCDYAKEAGFGLTHPGVPPSHYSAPAALSGILSTRAECALPAFTGGPIPSASRAAAGRRTQIGMRSDASKADS